MSKVVTVLVMLAVAARHARADDPLANDVDDEPPATVFSRPPAPPPPPPPMTEPTDEVDEEKSVGVAYALSIGATVGGFALVATGSEFGALGGVLLFSYGPAIGHSYVGEHGRALATSTVRLVGLVMAVGQLFEEEGGCVGGTEDNPQDVDCPGHSKLGIGAGLAIAATLFDLIDTPFAVNRYNERAAKARMQLAPMVMQTSRGATTGLAVGGTF